MPKSRILVLVHETLVPPDTLEGVRDQDAAEFRTEYDVITCLRNCGHQVRPVGIGDSLMELRTVLADWHGQLGGGAILMTWSDPSEPCGQGIRTRGLPSRTFVELDGGLITTVT